jgi:hypothetical protein
MATNLFFGSMSLPVFQKVEPVEECAVAEQAKMVFLHVNAHHRSGVRPKNQQQFSLFIK